MTARLTSRFAPALALSCLGAACTPAIAPSISDLPVLDGTSPCEIERQTQRVVVCRKTDWVNTSAAMEYPMLLQSQGWTKADIRDAATDRHRPAMWFEHRIDSDCSELISVDLGPLEYPDGNIGLIVIVQDHDPVCGSERRAQ